MSKFTIEQCKEMYLWTEEQFLKLNFYKMFYDYNLWLFPKMMYDLIPEDFMVEKITLLNSKLNTNYWTMTFNPAHYKKEFISFKYENNYETFKAFCEFTPNNRHVEYLCMGINNSLSYDETLIKSIIE
jgi:hypothetical protein